MVTFSDYIKKTPEKIDKIEIQIKLEAEIKRKVFGDFIRHTLFFGWGRDSVQITTHGISSEQIDMLINIYKATKVLIRPHLNDKILVEVYFQEGD